MSLVLVTAPAGAEGVLGPGSGGEIGGSIEERALVGAGGERVNPDRRMRYWLKLPLAGRLGNGRGVGYTLVLRPSTVTAPGRGAEPDVRFRQLDYDAGFRVSGIPATTLAASFARGRARGERGGAPLSETDISNRSAALTVGFRPLPLNAAILERQSDRTWSILPQAAPLRQAERTRTWRLAGQNTRTAVHIDRTIHDDRSFGNDFDAWSAGFAHTLRWGKGSRLQSALEHSERDGSFPFRQKTVQERLHLQHARAFSTDWDFSRHDSRGAANPARTESYGLALEHRPRPWLDWGAAARSLATRAPTIDARSIDTRVHLMIEHRWGGGLRTRANGDLGVEHRADRARGATTFAVVAERHVVNASRTFLLNLPNPDLTSVEVRGVEPPTVFVRDLDFGLAPVGDRVEIRLTPASRIRVGEVLEVDYRYVAAPSPEGRATSARYQLAAEYGVVSLRHSGSIRSSDPQAMGPPASAPDEQEARTELEARWAAGRGFVGIRGRHESRFSRRFEQRASEAQAEWTCPWGGDVRTSLIGGWNRHSGDGGRVAVVSGDARADWDAHSWLRLGALIQAYMLSRADSPSDGTVDGSLDAQLRVAAIDVSLRYRRQWAPGQARGARRMVSAQLTRRF